MWTLSYLSDGDDAQIKAVLDLNVSDRLIEAALCDKPTVVAPALRTIGNLLTGRDDLTEMMLDTGVLVVLSHLLSAGQKIFRKEACWAISNITAGASHQIEEVFAFNQGEILGKLINMVYHDDLDVKNFHINNLTLWFRLRENACSA